MEGSQIVFLIGWGGGGLAEIVAMGHGKLF